MMQHAVRPLLRVSTLQTVGHVLRDIFEHLHLCNHLCTNRGASITWRGMSTCVMRVHGWCGQCVRVCVVSEGESMWRVCSGSTALALHISAGSKGVRTVLCASQCSWTRDTVQAVKWIPPCTSHSASVHQQSASHGRAMWWASAMQVPARAMHITPHTSHGRDDSAEAVSGCTSLAVSTPTSSSPRSASLLVATGSTAQHLLHVTDAQHREPNVPHTLCAAAMV
jgi:hypothetical protein